MLRNGASTLLKHASQLAVTVSGQPEVAWGVGVGLAAQQRAVGATRDPSRHVDRICFASAPCQTMRPLAAGLGGRCPAALLTPPALAFCEPFSCVQGARGLAKAAEKEVKLPPQHGVPGRYAAALYMAAVKTDSLQKVEAELSQVANLMSDSKEFNTFVADPSVPRAVKIDGLNSILSKMGATDITKNFIGAIHDDHCWFSALLCRVEARAMLRRPCAAQECAVGDCSRCRPHNCAGLLSDNNRLSELGKILGKFEEIAADQRGEVKAVVTTAEVRGGTPCLLCLTHVTQVP